MQISSTTNLTLHSAFFHHYCDESADGDRLHGMISRYNTIAHTPWISVKAYL